MTTLNMSDQNCSDNDIKIFTFTEDEMWDIASQIGPHPHHFWKPERYYKNNVITYSIAPEVEHLRPIIEERMHKITLLTGIQFGEDKNAEMKFVAGTLEDGAAAQDDKIITFDLDTIQQNRIERGLSDEYFTKIVGMYAEHEIEHYLGIPHPTESASLTVQQFALSFHSSILQPYQDSYHNIILNRDPNKSQDTLIYNDLTSMGPFDIFLLQNQMNNSLWAWQGTDIKRELDYLSYFDTTGNVIHPNNGVITLNEFIIDKSIAITEMPRKDSSGESMGDIAIMTSRGFVVVPEILGKDSGEIVIQLGNGTQLSSGTIVPANGLGLTISDIETGLNKILRDPKEREGIDFLIKNNIETSSLVPYCNRTTLEDVEEPSRPAPHSSITDIIKQFLPFLP